MLPFCAAVVESLLSGRSVVYVCVIAQAGSAPRVSGARMLVYEDGTIWGTVGGGRYEGEAIHRAIPMLQNTDSPQAKVMKFNLRNVNDMDMVCGGEITLLLRRISPTQDQITLFTNAALAEKDGSPFLIFSPLHFTARDLEQPLFSPDDVPPSGSAPIALAVSTGRRNLTETALQDFSLACTEANFPPLTEASLEEIFSALPPNTTPSLYNMTNGASMLLERFFRRQRVFIFGAGHVARALARLTIPLDFDTIIIDDRAEFANEERFPGCEVMVPPTLEEPEAVRCLAAVNPRAQDAVIIMTRGHSCDRECLAAALPTQAGYIGMIGSRPKRSHVYALLRKSGFSATDLEKVHCPIGLSIGADTPEEIAVSIAAELIACLRATHKK